MNPNAVIYQFTLSTGKEIRFYHEALLSEKKRVFFFPDNMTESEMKEVVSLPAFSFADCETTSISKCDIFRANVEPLDILKSSLIKWLSNGIENQSLAWDSGTFVFDREHTFANVPLYFPSKKTVSSLECNFTTLGGSSSGTIEIYALSDNQTGTELLHSQKFNPKLGERSYALDKPVDVEGLVFACIEINKPFNATMLGWKKSLFFTAFSRTALVLQIEMTDKKVFAAVTLK